MNDGSAAAALALALAFAACSTVDDKVATRLEAIEACEKGCSATVAGEPFSEATKLAYCTASCTCLVDTKFADEQKANPQQALMTAVARCNEQAMKVATKTGN
jgi:hypothetical protein